MILISLNLMCFHVLSAVSDYNPVNVCAHTWACTHAHTLPIHTHTHSHSQYTHTRTHTPNTHTHTLTLPIHTVANTTQLSDVVSSS
jgi:hypothetical protein